MPAAGGDNDVVFMLKRHAIKGGACLGPLFEYGDRLTCKQPYYVVFSIQHNIYGHINPNHIACLIHVFPDRVSIQTSDLGFFVKHEAVVVLDSCSGRTTNDRSFGPAGETDKLMRVNLADNDLKICLSEVGIDPN